MFKTLEIYEKTVEFKIFDGIVKKIYFFKTKQKKGKYRYYDADSFIESMKHHIKKDSTEEKVIEFIKFEESQLNKFGFSLDESVLNFVLDYRKSLND